MDLILFWIEGRRWDILSGIVANQCLFSLFAILLIWQLGHRLFILPRLILLAAGTLVMVNPFGWQAIAWSLESSIYFCIALSVLSFALISAWPPDRGLFWLGVLAAGLSPLSFGAGLATLLAASVLVIIRYAAGAQRRPAIAASGLMVLALALAVLTLSPSNGLDFTHTVKQLAAVMMRVLSWPERHARGLVYVPSVVVIVLGGLSRRHRTHLFWFAATFDLWQLILTAQIAIGRFGDTVPSRYTEILVVGVVVNLACLMHLCQQAAMHPGGNATWRSGLAVAVAASWIVTLALAFYGLTPVLATDLIAKRDQSEAQAFNVAGFLKTNEARFVLPPAQIPYHTPTVLAQRLQQGAKADIFPPIFLQGDMPSGDKWRKHLGRVAFALALAGAAGLVLGLAGLLARPHRPVAP